MPRRYHARRQHSDPLASSSLPPLAAEPGRFAADCSDTVGLATQRRHAYCYCHYQTGLGFVHLRLHRQRRRYSGCSSNNHTMPSKLESSSCRHSTAMQRQPDCSASPSPQFDWHPRADQAASPPPHFVDCPSILLFWVIIDLNYIYY